ncbi:hypothetical protein V1512DRAFT_257919 [Lipomyces arxii]|uniref:uncharacterized protein n=1 Tax=Lipomyces arxii TaxID=56418 RepID=UPI0034CF08B1
MAERVRRFCHAFNGTRSKDMDKPYGHDSPLAHRWNERLVGKTLIETGVATDTQFPSSELPKLTRIIRPGAMQTLDFQPERLNVHVDTSGKVLYTVTG